MLLFVGDTIGVAVTPLLVRFVVRLDREHEVHEDEQGEDETCGEMPAARLSSDTRYASTAFSAVARSRIASA